MYLQQNCTRMEEAKEDYVLKWSEFQTNLTSTFDQLRRTEDFVDVTLSVGGRSIKCHKVSCHQSCKRLIGDVVQSRRRPLLGPSPTSAFTFKTLLRHYAKWPLTHRK